MKKKDYGKSLKDKDIPDALRLIFSNGQELRKDVINYFLGQLRVLLKWFEEQRLLRFYSSSLLFVYEGIFFEHILVQIIIFHCCTFFHLPRQQP